MNRSDIFPVHQGHLIKSPPDTGITGRMKSWRKRWFVLRGDKNLEYYDERAGRLIKTIDLSLCTCLDRNLFHKKFENVFSIKINGKSADGKNVDRIYYLVADTPYEMEQWTNHICNICDFQKMGNSANASAKHPKEVNEVKESTDTPPADHPSNIGTKMKSAERPDSGIQDSSNENNNTCNLPNYDMVSTPRELKNMDESLPVYDTPPQQVSLENYDKLPPHSRDMIRPPDSGYDLVPPPVTVRPDHAHSPCPLDISDSSDSPQNRSSGECNYDVPPDQPTYDVPPAQNEQNMEIYDVVPQHNKPYYQAPNSCTYDIVPPVHGSLPHNVGSLSVLHQRPPYEPDQPTYDIVPPVHEIASGTCSSQTYDFVPQRSIHDTSYESDQPTYDIVPPVHNVPKVNAYVNITVGDNVYNKPLPCPPDLFGESRDSGTVADFGSDDNYDVPPNYGNYPAYLQQSQVEHPPDIDRSSKPAPLIDRSSKPGQNMKEYVNLSKSSTFREPRPPHIKSKVQRSKSAAGDREAEGYLYMESPVKTESTSRFSKKGRELSTAYGEIEEESELSYEYMHMDSKRDSYENYSSDEMKQSNAETLGRKEAYSDTYENYDPQDLKQSSRHEISSDCYENYDAQDLKQKNLDSSHTKQLKGQYQDISVIQRQRSDLPPTARQKTNYTTIDLEKTKGFRKTCEQLRDVNEK